MIILGIDPGPESCGVVMYDTEKKRVLYASHDSSQYVYESLNRGDRDYGGIYWDGVGIEDIIPRGHAVGKTTFDTLRWVERYRTLCDVHGHTVKVISRGDVMIVLCGKRTYVDPVSGQRKGIKDAQLNQVIIDMVPHTGGGKRPWIGVKNQRGPLFGVTRHCWSALAVAITYINI